MNFLFFRQRHEADRLEQEARGRLERQKIQDEAEAEKSRRELLELQAQSAAVESTGKLNFISLLLVLCIFPLYWSAEISILHFLIGETYS